MARYESRWHAVADGVMAVVVWALRLGGIPARKATPAEQPWRGKRHAVGPAEVRVIATDRPPVQPAGEYCTFCGPRCDCKPVTTGGIA